MVNEKRTLATRRTSAVLLKGVALLQPTNGDAVLCAAKTVGRNCVRMAIPEGKATLEAVSEKKVTLQRP